MNEEEMSEISVVSALDRLEYILLALFGRTEGWEDATCGECAWASVWRKFGDIAQSQCRRVAWSYGRADSSEGGYIVDANPACPAFVRRAEGGA